MKRYLYWSLIFGFTLFFGLEVQPWAANPPPLVWDFKTDGWVVGGGAALWFGSELFKSDLAPGQCRWCSDNSVDRSARNELKWSNPEAANRLSNIEAFLLIPAASVGLDLLLAPQGSAGEDRWTDLGVIAESAVVAGDLNQVVKFTVGRERPFVHASSEDQKNSVSQPSDNNTSFYSGHTSLAFSMAISTGMVATYREYSNAGWIWASGLVLAGSTAYLRIAADRHYLTDVITGMALGSLAGFEVPFLAHKRAMNQNQHFKGMPEVSLGIDTKRPVLVGVWRW